MNGLNRKSRQTNIKENKDLKISVVMPSYNQGLYIEESIDSVLNQSYPDKELIILDNLSTDNTSAILKKYQKKARIIIERDKGQTDAINRGMRLAQGDILTYLNSDDLYEKNAFKKVAKFFSRNSETKIIYGKGKFIDASGRNSGYYKTASPTISNLFKECVISQPTVFMKREVFEKIGLFDDKLTYAMDYDYWIRVARKYSFGNIDSVLASTRHHSQTKTSQSEKVFDEILRVIKKNYGKVSDEAVFNLAYVSKKSPLERMKFASRIYIDYRQVPGPNGLKIFGMLAKSLLSK